MKGHNTIREAQRESEVKGSNIFDDILLEFGSAQALISTFDAATGRPMILFLIQAPSTSLSILLISFATEDSQNVTTLLSL